MKIYNVGNSLVNRYLLISNTHRLLIDSGYPGSLHDLGREMRSTGYKIHEIDFVMVTHFHVDHAGAVQELKNEGVKFILYNIQTPFIKSMEAMIKGKWKYTPIELECNSIQVISDSRHFLSQLGIDGQVIATPGHTDDSISLLLDSGEVFTGDLTPEHLLTDDTSAGKLSWRKLKDLGARDVFPGHGVIYNPNFESTPKTL